MIAILTGIVLFVGEIRLPVILSDTLSYVAAMMVPVRLYRQQVAKHFL